MGCPIEQFFYRTNTKKQTKFVQNLYKRLFSYVQGTLGCVWNCKQNVWDQFCPRNFPKLQYKHRETHISKIWIYVYIYLKSLGGAQEQARAGAGPPLAACLTDRPGPVLGKDPGPQGPTEGRGQRGLPQGTHTGPLSQAPLWGGNSIGPKYGRLQNNARHTIVRLRQRGCHGNPSVQFEGTHQLTLLAYRARV